MNLDTLDKSFLRLVTDFSVAKSEMMVNSQYVYKDTIVISPSEKTLQISNSLTSIAFDDSYIVSLVDCSDNVILDITDKVYINEFQDHNGIFQIGFEIAPILQDFYFQRLYLRFEHTGSDLVLWSNSFICTDNVQSVRLDYKNYSYYQGVSYEIANFYQSIRIAGYFNLPSSKDSTKITTLINGDIRRSRTTQALEYTYNIDAIDTFAFDRLMVALNSELVYIDGVRFVTSENVQSDERQGMSNQFATTFKGQFVATEKYVASFQIAPKFAVIDYYPKGLYTLATISNEISLTFNYDAIDTDNTNLRVLLYKDNSFIDYLDLVQDVNPLIWKQAYTFVNNGEYEIRVPANKYKSIYGDVLEYMVFKFSIQDGEFDNTEFDNTEFFTNL